MKGETLVSQSSGCGVTDKPKHDILPVLEHYGLEVRDGMGWIKVRCPFHGDSHASAAVNPELNVFKCFACQIGGDTYGIIMQHEGKSFSEAYAIAQKISTISNTTLSTVHSYGRRVPNKSGSHLARRGYTPPGGRRGPTTRSRTV